MNPQLNNKGDSLWDIFDGRDSDQKDNDVSW